MCLAVPIKIIKLIDDNYALGDLQGVTIEFSTQLLENPLVGKYAIVHAGVAIEMLDEEEAEKTISLLLEVDKLGSD